MATRRDSQENYDVLIVGGGHGGAQTAISLRQLGFLGSLAIVGEETDIPYERPPLSKEYFSGEKEFTRICIRPEHFWSEREVTMILGERVVAVDPVKHVVRTRSGRFIGYGKLVWATGGAARMLQLAGGDLDGIHTIRSRQDVDQLRNAAVSAKVIAIIGGGYIGLEAAAVLSKGGKKVVLLEMQDRVLARVAGVALSRFMEGEHRAHGVDIRLGVGIERLEGEGHISAVVLSDGERIACDLVICGIGIVPEVEPLRQAGAKGQIGILVDEHCRASLPDIYAIGDCTEHSNTFAECAVIRLESVQNANDMAMTVGKAIVGQPRAYLAVPWFWSNQYDLRIQTIGLSTGHDDVVVRGDPSTRRFSLIYLREGRVIALDCVNTAKDYVQGKALVIAGARIAPELLADAAMPLKELLGPEVAMPE